jgi:serine/threonine protein kinase
MNILETKYIVLETIGSGKFGKIYKGMNRRTNEIVAIKKEKKESLAKLLKHETIILNYLYRNNCPNIPLVYWFGNIEGDSYLVMPFYKKIHFEQNEEKINQLNNFMVQMISILNHVHLHHIIHRDIKPANIMILHEKYYLIDFGLSTFYIDDNMNHVKNSLKEYILGTPNYISINIHNGEEPSRRDDLISLGYVYLYYLFNKSLFWEDVYLNVSTGINTNVKQEHLTGNPNYILSAINQTKKEKKQELLVYLRSNEYTNICHYLEYCYKLEYDKKPNYDGFIQLFS